jgi:hypothetical protein
VKIPPLKWILAALEIIGAATVTIMIDGQEKDTTLKDAFFEEATTFASMVAITTVSMLKGFGDTTELSDSTKYVKKVPKVVILG